MKSKHTKTLYCFLAILIVMMIFFTACTGKGNTPGTPSVTSEEASADVSSEESSIPEQSQESPQPEVSSAAASSSQTQTSSSASKAASKAASSASSSQSSSKAASQPKENDIGKAVEKEYYTVTVHTAAKVSDTYEVTLTLKYSGPGTHPLSAPERFFIIDAEKNNISVTNIYDENGESLTGSSLNSGESRKIKAVFKLTNGFSPDVFRYVFNINGFQSINIRL